MGEKPEDPDASDSPKEDIEELEGSESELLSLHEFLDEILEKTNKSVPITLREFLAEILGKEDTHRPLTLREFLNLTPDSVTVASSDGSAPAIFNDMQGEELRSFRLRRLADAVEILDSFNDQRRASRASEQPGQSMMKHSLSSESISLLDFIRESQKVYLRGDLDKPRESEGHNDHDQFLSGMSEVTGVMITPFGKEDEEELDLSPGSLVSRLRNLSTASQSDMLKSIAGEENNPLGNMGITNFLENIINKEASGTEKVTLRSIVEFEEK